MWYVLMHMLQRKMHTWTLPSADKEIVKDFKGPLLCVKNSI